MTSSISFIPEHKTDLLMQCVDTIIEALFHDVFFIAVAVPTN
jgi:hypothetical protein